MARKPTIGDICEVKTPAGLAYIQYTHDHPSMGQLMRVLPGLFAARPDIKKLAQQRELYFFFFALQYALRDRLLDVVSNEPVPQWARSYPLMRADRGSDRSGKTLSWLILDASKQLTLDEIPKMLKVIHLTPEQEKFSIYELWGHRGMVQRLAEGWTPDHAEEFRLKEIAAAETRNATKAGLPQEAKSQFLDHYLYFPQKSLAQQAGDRLQAKGWTVEVKREADGKNWLALAKQPAPIEENIAEVREELEHLAEELHGEYDGWGASV